MSALLADLASSEAVGFLEAKPSTSPDPTLLGSGPGGAILGATRSRRRSAGRHGQRLARPAQRRPLRGHVAVKLLNASLIGRAGGERFKREGRILARLTHPNIARLIDAGVSRGPAVPGARIRRGRADRRFCDERSLERRGARPPVHRRARGGRAPACEPDHPPRHQAAERAGRQRRRRQAARLRHRQAARRRGVAPGEPSSRATAAAR